MSTAVRIFGLRQRRILSRVRRVTLRVARELGLDGELEIVLADSRLMKRLNSTYRRKHKATDVLAFSYPTDGPGNVVRGQVFLNRIALERPNQLTRLLVHAIVHIKGYDHKTALGARRMRRVEEKILKLF